MLTIFLFDFSYRVYLDKNVSLQLNKGRKVSGTLRGYDQFMNLVLGNAIEETSGNQKNNVGIVVVRGNSILQVSGPTLCIFHDVILISYSIVVGIARLKT